MLQILIGMRYILCHISAPAERLLALWQTLSSGRPGHYQTWNRIQRMSRLWVFSFFFFWCSETVRRGINKNWLVSLFCRCKTIIRLCGSYKVQEMKLGHLLQNTLSCAITPQSTYSWPQSTRYPHRKGRWTLLSLLDLTRRDQLQPVWQSNNL